MDTLKNKADFILSKVTEAGAQADLIIDTAQSLSLKANQGELEEHKVSSSQIFGLRVIKDGSVGSAYSEADDEVALSSIVEQALINASFTAPDEHENILDNQQKLTSDDSLLCPLDESSIEDKISLTLELEKALLSKSKIKNVPYNGVTDALAQRHVFSTAGLSASLRQRSVATWAYALAEDGEKNAMEGYGQLARRFDALDSKFIISTVYDQCMAMLEGAPVASGHYDVIFDTECQDNLFDTFAMALSGKSAKDGINPWRDSIGKVVADPRLQLSDSPRLTEGFGYALFDSEGTATANTPLIVDGKLQTLLHNSATASYFGGQTTGHATRGPKSSLSTSSHQLTIAKGSDSLSSLQSGSYIEITNLTGLHSGANAISGDFSFGASGYLCKDGQRTQAIRGITVAGNFYKMLTKITAIGDVQNWNWQKSSFMPAIRFASLAISGE